jgi:hypothetical protein
MSAQLLIFFAGPVHNAEERQGSRCERKGNKNDNENNFNGRQTVTVGANSMVA